MKKRQLLSNIASIFLVLGIITAILAICFFVFHLPDFWSQLLAIITSAFLGVGATAFITNTLLKNQQESEEAKEKNIKVYENKIQVYSEFISKMWKTLEDDVITDEEIRGIRSDIFNKLIFYLKKDDIIKLGEKVRSIKSSDSYNDGEDKAINKAKKTTSIIECFSEITELLRADVNNNEQTEAKQEISRLWNYFGVQPRENGAIPDKPTVAMNEEKVNPETASTTTQTLNCGFWHFAMLGANEQIAALRNGVYELNLIEYEEEWRTNLIKQVKENDLVFLFRSGGFGYMGVYRILGWRVFQFLEGDKVVETIKIGKNEETITDKTRILNDLKRSDIYHSREDGADFCSSLIVEPLAFAKNGIGNPGGVYRRTISRYDHGYGLMQLARFMAIMNDPNNYDVHFDGETTVKMGCNKKKFIELLKSGDIKPAEIDENGNWK